MLSRPEQFLHRFIPIFYRLIIHFHYDILDQRRTDTFVSKRKMNVGRVAAVELEDWPYRRTHLLPLHVGGVTGNTESQEPNKRRDHCVVSAGAARLLLLQHGGEHIADAVSVNQATNCRASGLLRPQRNHRLNATGSARGNPAGEKRDGQQEQGDAREGHRIGSAHAVEQAFHHARAAEGNE